MFKDKKAQLAQYGGEGVVRGEEFKRYVNKLRGKSTLYKVKRSELAELRAEYGVLSRTEEILRSKEDSVQQALVRSIIIKNLDWTKKLSQILEIVSKNLLLLKDYKFFQ